MKECINLAARFGDDYRITADPAVEGRNDKQDVWMMQIPCHRGIIYPYGGETLAVEVDQHNILARRLSEIEGITPYQDGEYEKTFLFHVDMFPVVAEIVRPRMRRKLSPEQQAILSERGKALLAGVRRKYTVDDGFEVGIRD